MTELMDYAPALPEIVLAVGAMALLMFGAFSGARTQDSEAPGWLAILILAVAAVADCPAGAWRRSGSSTAPSSSTASRASRSCSFSAGSAAALLLSFDYLRRAKIAKYEIPVLVLLSVVGMMMMVSASDLIALYLGLELQSLALYVLAAIRRDNLRSSEAGLKYFVLGALSSGMLLYGASLLYGFTGSTSFSAIASVGARRWRGRQHRPRRRPRVSPGRARLQDLGRALPYVDARRLRRRADAGDGVLRRRAQARGHGAARARARRRFPGDARPVAADRRSSSPSPRCCSAPSPPSARPTSSA